MQFQNCMEFGYPPLIFGLFLLRPKFHTVMNLAWATYGMKTFSALDFQVVNLHARFLSERVNTYTSDYVIISEFIILLYCVKCLSCIKCHSVCGSNINCEMPGSYCLFSVLLFYFCVFLFASFGILPVYFLGSLMDVFFFAFYIYSVFFTNEKKNCTVIESKYLCCFFIYFRFAS